MVLYSTISPAKQWPFYLLYQLERDHPGLLIVVLFCVIIPGRRVDVFSNMEKKDEKLKQVTKIWIRYANSQIQYTDINLLIISIKLLIYSE